MSFGFEPRSKILALLAVTTMVLAWAPPVRQQPAGSRPTGSQLEACGQCTQRLLDLRRAAHRLRLAAQDPAQKDAALRPLLEAVERAHIQAVNSHLVLTAALTAEQRSAVSVPLKDMEGHQQAIEAAVRSLKDLLGQSDPPRGSIGDRARALEKDVIRWQMAHELIDHAMHVNSPRRK